MNPANNKDSNNPPRYSNAQQGAYPLQQPEHPAAAYNQGAYTMQMSTVGGAAPQPVITVQPQMVAPGAIVQQPEDHATIAWLSCLCCFWPLGLVAIIKSKEVNNAYSRGDVQGANVASRSARQFSLLSIGIGVASWIIIVIFIVLRNTIFAVSRRSY